MYRPENDGSHASELEQMKAIQRLVDAADAKQLGTIGLHFTDAVPTVPRVR